MVVVVERETEPGREAGPGRLCLSVPDSVSLSTTTTTTTTTTTATATSLAWRWRDTRKKGVV